MRSASNPYSSTSARRAEKCDARVCAFRDTNLLAYWMHGTAYLRSSLPDLYSVKGKFWKRLSEKELIKIPATSPTCRLASKLLKEL